MQCPKSDHGVYPNGGCCHFCESVEHLAKDCPKKTKKSKSKPKSETVELSKEDKAEVDEVEGNVLYEDVTAESDAVAKLMKESPWGEKKKNKWNKKKKRTFEEAFDGGGGEPAKRKKTH
jgi:zinc finger CCHC domain-containing protein 9